MKSTILILLLSVLTACSLPRGAALQSEVLKAADETDAPYAVYPVTRSTVGGFRTWPHHNGFRTWGGSIRGPASPVIRAGDLLDLVVWDNSENSLLLTPGAKVVNIQGVKVEPDGTIFVPYLEQLYVNGMSPEGARRLIQEQMAELLPSAQVQLAYTAGSGSSVSLVGGVSAPGTFPLPSRNFTVLNLIAQGGGVSPAMRNPQVSLVRGGKTYRTSLKQLYADADRDVVLRGGDKIIVEQDNRYFQALGSTGREELINYDRDEITALEAVSLVGGINDNRADPKGVLILREYAPDEVRRDGTGPSRTDVVFTVDLTSADGLFSARRFLIRPGDVVLVTESPMAKAQTIFAVIGRVFGLANTAQAISD